MRKANLRAISFVLILIFTQKLGLGLWLHNWLHHPRGSHSSAFMANGRACLELQPAKCHCIDDALMPLIKSHPLEYQEHQKHLLALLLTGYPAAISRDKIFPALRGPPSAQDISKIPFRRLIGYPMPGSYFIYTLRKI